MEGDTFKPGQLTRNFYLVEFVRSKTATARGYNEQFHPPDNVVNNLEKLCIHVLQPVRDHLPNGVIRVTSGYRCPRLNSDPKVGGKPTSQHLTGKAADIQYLENDQVNNQCIVDTIKKLNLQVDQVISEDGWIHVSYSEGSNRNQVFSLHV